MGILFGIVLFIYIMVCLFLILLVLIQSDKGGGISGAFGGGLSGANTLLGTQDTQNILTRATTIFAISFMGLCIIISLFLSRGISTASEQGKSIMQERAEKQGSYAPASILQEGGLQIEEGENAQGAGEPEEPSGEMELQLDESSVGAGGSEEEESR